MAPLKNPMGYDQSRLTVGDRILVAILSVALTTITVTPIAYLILR